MTTTARSPAAPIIAATLAIAAAASLTAGIAGPDDTSVGSGVLGIFLGVSAATVALSHWEGTRKHTRGQKLAAWGGIVAVLTVAMIAAPLAHQAVIGARSAERALSIDSTRLDDGIYTATSMPGGTLRYDARTGLATLAITLTNTDDRVPLVAATLQGVTEGGACESAKRVLAYGDDVTVALKCPGLTAADVRAAGEAHLAGSTRD